MIKEQERQVQAMYKLGFSDEEIADILETDKRIDKGEKLFELADDLKAGAKKARQAERKKSPTYEFTKRERKPNDSKRAIINALVETARELADDETVQVTNIEREIIFIANGIKYKIVLSAPRK